MKSGRFNAIIKSYSNFGKLLDFGNLIVLDSVFEPTDDHLRRYQNLDGTENNRKSPLKLGVFLFEHGSGSDPDLIRVSKSGSVKVNVQILKISESGNV